MHHLLTSAVLVFALSLATPLSAQQGEPFLSRLGKSPFVNLTNTQEAAVPAGWTEVTEAELQRVLDWAEKSTTTREGTGPQPVAVIESAVYRATFAGSDLREGAFTFQVAHRGTGTAFLDWSTGNISVQRLRVGDAPAVWGTASDGRQLVAVSGSGVFEGHWSKASTRSLESAQFEIQFPAALNTVLSLRLPRQYQLKASRGLVSPPVPDAEDAGFQVWNLDLGRYTSVNLRIIDSAAGLVALPLTASVSSLFTARPDGLYMQSDFSTSGLNNQQQSLAIQIPRELNILAVAVSGNNLPYRIQSAKTLNNSGPEGAFKELLIPVDRQESPGAKTSIRIRGFLPATWSRPVELPRAKVINAIELDRSLRLLVESPLVAHDIRTEGLIQTALQHDELGETWSFEAVSQKTKLTVELSRPSPTVTVQSRAVADLSQEIPISFGEFTLGSTEGSAFQLDLNWPASWDLISVEGADSASKLARWELVPQSDGASLRVEFRQPLIAGTKRILRFKARANLTGQNTEQVLPVPLLEQSGSNSAQCWVVSNTAQYDVDVPDLRFHNSMAADIPVDVLSLMSHYRIPPGSFIEFWTLNDSSSVRRPVLKVPSSSRPEKEPDSRKSAVELPPASLTGVYPEGSGNRVGCSLQLATTNSNSDESRQMHQATYTFARPVSPQALEVRLPEQAALSLVVTDDGPVTVFRTGERLTFPESSRPTRSLELVYVTEVSQGGIYHEFTFPVPQLQAQVLQFSWLPNLSAGTNLVDCSLPGPVGRIKGGISLTERLLGPLGRGSQGEFFSPWKTSDWQDLLVKEHRPGNWPSKELSPQVLSRVAPESITFTTWSRPVTESYAWIAFFGSLFFWAWMRVRSWSWYRFLLLSWCAAILVGSLFQDDAAGLICGGAFAGTLLSVLLPHSFVFSRDLLNRFRDGSRQKESSSKSWIGQSAVVTGIILLSQFVSADNDKIPVSPPAPRVIEVLTGGELSAPRYWVQKTDLDRLTRVIEQPQSAIRSLIRQAGFRLGKTTNSLNVEATFEILVREEVGSDYVTIPLRNVTFRDDVQCTVNGKPVRIIPSTDGNAVIVPMSDAGDEPESPTAPPSEAEVVPGKRWKVRNVVISFVMRAQPSGAISTQDAFVAAIPPVYDAVVTCENLAGNIKRYGTAELSVPESVQLGPLAQLEIARSELLPIRGSAQSFYHLALKPYSYRGTVWSVVHPDLLNMGSSHDGKSLLKLTLPETCLVRELLGPNILEWKLTKQESGLSEILILLDVSQRPDSIELQCQFDSPLDQAGPAGDDTLRQQFSFPRMKFDGLNVDREVVAVSLPSGAEIAGAPLDSPVQDVNLVSEWQRRTGSPLSSFSWIGNINSTELPLDSTRKFTWDVVFTSPKWSWQVADRVVIDVDKLIWQAQISSVGNIQRPFMESIQVPADVDITSVTATQAARQRPIRWIREGERLTVFLPDNLGGPLEITIAGSRPLNLEAWTPAPRITGASRPISKYMSSYLDRTFWSVKLAAEGEVVAEAPVRETQGTSERVIHGDNTQAGRPILVEVTPGASAARSTWLCRVQSYSEFTDLLTEISITPTKGVLQSVRLYIPAGQQLVRILPEGLEYDSSVLDDGRTKIVCHVPARSSRGLVCKCLCRIDTPLPELNRILAPVSDSAIANAYLWSLGKGDATRVASGEVIDLQEEQVREALTPKAAEFSLVAGTEYFQTATGELPLKALGEDNSLPVVPLHEIVTWQLDPEVDSGESTIWAKVGDYSMLHVSIPEGLTVEAVITDGEAQAINFDDRGNLTIPVKATGVCTPVSIFWQRPRSEELKWPTVDSAVVSTTVLAQMKPGITSDAHTDSLTNLDASLEILDGLLDCLASSAGSVEMDSPVLTDCRRIREFAGEAVNDMPETQQEAYLPRISQLDQRWNEIQKQLLVTSARPGKSARAFPANNLIRLCTQETSGEIPVTYTLVTGNSLRIKSANSLGTPFSELVAKGSRILGILGFWIVAYIVLLDSCRSWVAKRPGLSCSVLGFIWWLLFQFSAIGFVLLIGGAAYEFYRLLLHSQSRIPAVTESA